MFGGDQPTAARQLDAFHARGFIVVAQARQTEGILTAALALYKAVARWKWKKSLTCRLNLRVSPSATEKERETKTQNSLARGANKLIKRADRS